MTLNLNLPSELAELLNREAQRHGVSPDTYTVQMLEKHLAPEQRRGEVVALLQSWIDADDADDQSETGDFLIRALDDDRPSDRKLYPPEMEGISW